MRPARRPAAIPCTAPHHRRIPGGGGGAPRSGFRGHAAGVAGAAGGSGGGLPGAFPAGLPVLRPGLLARGHSIAGPRTTPRPCKAVKVHFCRRIFVIMTSTDWESFEELEAFRLLRQARLSFDELQLESPCPPPNVTSSLGPILGQKKTGHLAAASIFATCDRPRPVPEHTGRRLRRVKQTVPALGVH